MDYNYNGYNRGYTEPAMTSADYMNRTYRWMAVEFPLVASVTSFSKDCSFSFGTMRISSTFSV